MKTSSIKSGDTVAWTDPDGGERIEIKVAKVMVRGDAVTLEDDDGSVIECHEHELSPADEETAAAEGVGLHYRSPEWRRLAECAQWHNLWPVIDADGKLTGLVVADDDGFFNVDDEAMLAEDDIDFRWREVDGYALPVTAIIEAAVADETIRGAGLDDLAGLENPAMPEACAAYRQAAVAALEDDPRAGRLSVGAPLGQRLLASGWSGAHWRHSSGAIGTMFELTEDEQAALSAADDAGLAAAGEVIKQADAAGA